MSKGKRYTEEFKIEAVKRIETTVQDTIVAEARIISENEESLEYRGHILKNAKGGTECFSKDILGLRGLELREYLT